METKNVGKVKWFNNQKGIGFIQKEDGIDIFVHYKSILNEGHRTLKKGQSVSFQVVDTEYGVQAADVSVQKNSS